MDSTYPLVPIINLLAMILGLLPVITRNFKTWNISLVVGVVAAAILCLCVAVDAIIWSDNASDRAPAWCDISTHSMVACKNALPASCLALTRRLYLITRLNSGSASNREKRSQLLFDLTICIILPLANPFFYYIGQSRRYIIIEEFGCSQSTASAGLPSILRDLLPVLMSGISAVYYCPRALLSYYKHKKEIIRLLEHDRNISLADFTRTATMGFLEVVVFFPCNIFVLVQPFLQGPDVFWPGWRTIHSQKWWVIPQYRTAEWETFGFWYIFGIRWRQYSYVCCALSFFILFGLHAEARNRYRQLFRSTCRLLGSKTDVSPARLNLAPFLAAVPDCESSDSEVYTVGNCSAVIAEHSSYGTIFSDA